MLLLVATFASAASVRPLGAPWTTFISDLTIVSSTALNEEMWTVMQNDAAVGAVQFGFSEAAASEAVISSLELPGGDEALSSFTHALLLRRFAELELTPPTTLPLQLSLPPFVEPGEEVVDCCDTKGSPLAALPRGFVHAHNILLRGVGIVVRRPTTGEIYVHRRSASKRHFPSMYDMFIGGMATAGEVSDASALRELGEELGLALDDEHRGTLEYKLRCLVATTLNRVSVDVFEYTCAEGEEIRHVDGEVEWGEYVDDAGLARMMADEDFVPDGLQVWDALQEDGGEESQSFTSG